MSVSDPQELFVHELKDILFAERTIEKALPKLAREAKDGQLKAAITHHLDETQQQIANLTRVFEDLDMAARGQRCPGIEGLMKEHDEFMKENKGAPSRVVDTFLCGAASRTEHYEIAAYTGLVTMAKAMGEDQAAKLLEQNLKQEKETLRTVEKIGRRLSKSAARNGGAATRSRRSTTPRRRAATRSRRATARTASPS